MATAGDARQDSMTEAGHGDRPSARAEATRRMLEARSIAVVGASERPGSFGDRLTREVLSSPSKPTVHLVHPKYERVHGRRVVPSLADVPESVDLVVLGVPDSIITEQVTLAAGRGDASAVVFGSVHGIGSDIAAAAATGGMALCGGGCMGFVNQVAGVRAIGYVERNLEPGPIAMVTHSGSVFSSMLRTHRRLDYSLVVSAGQELVTTASDYLQYAVELDETRVIGMFIETMRDVTGLRTALTRALERDVPVVALTVGGSPAGRAMVNAHSGAIAGDDAAWEALFAAFGVHRVSDLDELIDSLELFAIGRRVRPGGPSGGVATLHDSGGERALIADVAHQIGLPFAPLTDPTRERLGALLAPGLQATNPLDVWGTGAGTEDLFTACMEALADDETVDAVALAIDLCEEYDGDEAYPRAMEAMLARTDKPLAVLSHVASSIDQYAATRLRAHGVPVLEGTVSGAKALRHLIAHATPPPLPTSVQVDEQRRRRWTARIDELALPAGAGLPSAVAAELLADYELPLVPTLVAASRQAVIAAAGLLGYPVVLKTDQPGIDHKADVGGVVLGLADEDAVSAAYDDLAHRLGPAVTVQHQAAGQVELALGLVRDPLVGPLVLLAVGGVLVEVVAQRSVALPPLTRAAAESMVDGLPVVATLLAGVRGNPACNRDAVVDALVALGQLAVEVGDRLAAVDLNPLMCTPESAVAVDALVIPASRS